MSKEDQRIIAVERKILFADGEFQGFVRHSVFDYEKVILNNMQNVRRGSVSEDPNHPLGNAEKNYLLKQPIGYTLIVNPFEQKTFAYKRATKDKNYDEDRLKGNWSWGVGGHVEPLDSSDEKNSLRESRLREVGEEIFIDGKIIGTNVLGYINDDSNDVSKVHFGILYLVEIDGAARKRDDEMEIGEMMSLTELESLLKNEKVIVENWSKIALGPLKEYFPKRLLER